MKQSATVVAVEKCCDHAQRAIATPLVSDQALAKGLMTLIFGGRSSRTGPSLTDHGLLDPAEAGPAPEQFNRPNFDT
jgi:hypothetical protein